jgi:hypothetical protein
MKVGLNEGGLKDVDWILVAKHTDKWQDIVNMVMNLRVP